MVFLSLEDNLTLQPLPYNYITPLLQDQRYLYVEEFPTIFSLRLVFSNTVRPTWLIIIYTKCDWGDSNDLYGIFLIFTPR